MGEVYRADDLTLGIPVALKFLSSAFVKDPDRLGRFYNEVRIAREISHPSVCRVHDIGDVEGQPFLSMEYVAVRTCRPCCAGSADCRPIRRSRLRDRSAPVLPRHTVKAYFIEI